jgi:hypothetical protein
VNGSTYSVIVTITDPNGDTVFTQTYPGAATIEFPFSDTPTIGTYTVTADCDVDHATCNGETIICGAGTADVIGSYTAGQFTVVAADAAPADPAADDVVAATPTFTG